MNTVYQKCGGSPSVKNELVLRKKVIAVTDAIFLFSNWVFLQELATSIEKKFIGNQRELLFSLILLMHIHMALYMYKGICRHTNAYFCFVTNENKGLCQGEHNSTKTSNIKTIKLSIRLTLFFLLIMKNYYLFSI